mgnify:CR=1 FL=1
MELTDLTIAEATPLLHERKISPVELTRAYLQRIERLNPLLNAYITVTAEGALDAARQAEDEIMRGEYRGLLHGIPIALKDNIETAGVRTTAGSSFLRDYVPTEDAEVVKQLKSAGAIILGKTNMHEWAFGVINNNPWYGDTRNPWDTARITGGSSGGSAAAVAAKMCMAALGTDTRGSVRIPAALCGVVGFKPHHWHISKLGVIPLSKTLDHVGVLARTPADAELVYAVSDGNVRGKFGFPVSTKRATRRKLRTQGVKRVGIARDGFTSMVSPSVQTCIDAIEKWVADEGLECGFVDLSFIEETWKASRIVSSVEAAAYHLERTRSNPQGFGDDVRPRLEEGMGYGAVEYVQAVNAGDAAEERLRAIFHQYDVLLLPTLPITAPRHDDAQGIADARLRFSGFNAPFNLASCYAMSVPVGLDEQGLPIGIQILANTPYLGYLGYFAFAQQLQQGVGWDGRLPEL